MLPSLRLSSAALAAVVVLAAPAGAQARRAGAGGPGRRHTVQAGAPLTFTARGRARSSSASPGRPQWSTAAAPSPRTAGASTARRRRRARRLVQFTAPAGLAAGEWFWQVGNPADCTAGPGPAHRGRRIEPGADDAAGRPARPAGRRRRDAAQALAHPDPVAHRHEQPRPARPGARRGLALGLAQPLRHARAQQRAALAPGCRAARSSASPAWATRTTTSASPPGSSRRARWAPPPCCARTTCASGRVCAASGCRTMRTPAGSRIVERDLALLPDVPWAQGPAHPSAEEYDLETVILHELGHWAGNLRHTPVGLSRHADGQGPRPRRVVALAHRLALRRLREARPRRRRARRALARRAAASASPSASSSRPSSSVSATRTG